jgi:hypothetical protein
MYSPAMAVCSSRAWKQRAPRLLNSLPVLRHAPSHSSSEHHDVSRGGGDQIDAKIAAASPCSAREVVASHNSASPLSALCACRLGTFDRLHCTIAAVTT